MARGISPETTGGADLGSSTQRWGTVFANVIDPGAHVNGAYNKKETFTTSGTFVAPVTGTYRITLQGGGGGGSGAGTSSGVHLAGSGGGSGAHITTYEKLTAGVSYSYVVGAGGAGGAAGSSADPTPGQNGTNGGATTITIGSNSYSAGGGNYALGTGTYARPGAGGSATLNGQNIIGKGYPGGAGSTTSSINAPGGNGGGACGGPTDWVTAVYGGGGGGGHIGSDASYNAGGAGGDGYITFEYYDPTA